MVVVCVLIWDTFPIRQDNAGSASSLARIHSIHVNGGNPVFPRTPILDEWPPRFAHGFVSLRARCDSNPTTNGDDSRARLHNVYTIQLYIIRKCSLVQYVVDLFHMVGYVTSAVDYFVIMKVYAVDVILSSSQ